MAVSLETIRRITIQGAGQASLDSLASSVDRVKTAQDQLNRATLTAAAAQELATAATAAATAIQDRYAKAGDTSAIAQEKIAKAQDKAALAAQQATAAHNGVTAAQGRLAQASSTTATVADMASRKSLSAAEAYKRQTMSIDPLARNHDLLARSIKTATTAYNQGVLGEVGSAQSKAALAGRIALLTQKYGESSQAATVWSQITERGTQVATSYAGGLGVLGTAVAGLSVGWLAAAAAIGAGAILLKKGTDEYENHVVEMARLNAQLRATGSVSGQTASGIEEMALGIARATNLTKDSVEQAASALLVYDRVGPAVFERTIKAAANMSAVFGGDLASNASKLGLALDDPVDGMNRLRRSGLDLSVAQKEVITNLEHSGDLLGAQTALLDALDQRLGGTAAATHTGLTGSTHDVSVAWTEMLEKLGQTTHIGSAAAGGLDLITAALDHLEKGIDYADKKVQKSPSISKILGWQNGQYNPIGVVQNVGAMAGYGTGDRGLFDQNWSASYGKIGEYTPPSTKDKTLEDTAGAIRAHNVDLKWQATEAGKSPVQQAIDNELKTLATSLHLDVAGLRKKGEKDPDIASAIAETESLARIKAQATATEKLKETFDGYLHAQHQSAINAGLTTAEHERQDAVLKGINVRQAEGNVLAKDRARDYEAAVLWAERHGKGGDITKINASVAEQQGAAFRNTTLRQLEDQAASYGFAPGDRAYETAKLQAQRQSGTGFNEKTFKTDWGKVQSGAANDNLRQLREQTNLLALSGDERERESEILAKINAGQIVKGSAAESDLRTAIASRQEMERTAKLVDSFGDRFGNVIDTAAFDTKNTGQAVGTMLRDTSKDMFHESVTRPITDSLTGGLKSAFGIGGKRDGSSELSALYVQMVGAAGGTSGVGDIGSMFSKGGFVSNLFNGGGGEGSTSSSILGALSSFAGLFDEGGTIGPGQWGIKSGIPEIIQGGTHGVSVARVPTFANNNSGWSQAPIVISHGGNHVTITGNADTTTIALMQAELDKRDRAFEGKVMAATAKAKSGFRGAWAGD